MLSWVKAATHTQLDLRHSLGKKEQGLDSPGLAASKTRRLTEVRCSLCCKPAFVQGLCWPLCLHVFVCIRVARPTVPPINTPCSLLQLLSPITVPLILPSFASLLARTSFELGLATLHKMSHVPMMLRPIKPEDLAFPHEMNTNRDLLAFANLMIRPPPSKPVEVFMICDIVQCLITLFACTNVMVKKGRMRDFRLITWRKSPYGTFIVPNAIWILLTGVVVYLVQWTVFCTWIVFVQKTNRPLAEWLWYIPFPW